MCYNCSCWTSRSTKRKWRQSSKYRKGKWTERGKNRISWFNAILTKLHSFQTLDEDEFVAFYYNLLERPEIDKLFATYTKESPGKMSANALLQFLQNEQKDGATVIEECQEIIKYVLNMQVYSSAKHHPQELWTVWGQDTLQFSGIHAFSHLQWHAGIKKKGK